jgi:4-alpha-glucanotransferase
VDTLQHQGLLSADFHSVPPATVSCPAEVREGVLEYLAQSRAGLLEVRLEEIFGLTEQQNLPGTVAAPPNWRRKLPFTLKKMRRAPEPPRLAVRLNKYRGRDKLGGGNSEQ